MLVIWETLEQPKFRTPLPLVLPPSDANIGWVGEAASFPHTPHARKKEAKNTERKEIWESVENVWRFKQHPSDLFSCFWYPPPPLPHPTKKKKKILSVKFEPRL